MSLFFDSIKETEKKLKSKANFEVNMVWEPYQNNEYIILSSFLPPDLVNIVHELYDKKINKVIFKWNSLTKEFGNYASSGYVHLLSPSEIKRTFEEQKKIVRDSINNDLAKENDGYRLLIQDLGNWIPIFMFPNGDYFCVDLRKTHYPVVFLEHDVMDGGPFIHGLQIASDIVSLINIWRQILFVDYFDWSLITANGEIDLKSKDLNSLKEYGATCSN